MIWTDSYLNDKAIEGEKEISKRVPCVFHRFSLAVTQGSALYELPTGIVDIIAITWKGFIVEPLQRPGLEEAVPHYKPLNAGAQSRPKDYIRYGYGYKIIEFRPVPNETIAADDSNIFGSAIVDRVIISCWRVADPTNESYRVPDTIRRLLVKYYVLAKAFAKESKGKNIPASDYYKQKFEWFLESFKEIQANVRRSVKIILSDTTVEDNELKKPARPSMPSGGKWSI